MIFLKILLLILTVALGACSHVFYQPTQGLIQDPNHPNPAAWPKGLEKPEIVWFKNADGTNLNGWFFKATTKRKQPGPGPILVLFHGNAENLSTHFANLLWVTRQGYDFFVFDYQGYGLSEGEPSAEGTINDGLAALKYLHDRFSGRGVVLVGQSLGGIIAMRVALAARDKIPIHLVVADSTFASYQDMGAKVLARHWYTWWLQPLAYLLVSDDVAMNKDTALISPVPLVVIHGTADEVVEFEMGQKVYDLASEPKEFWKIEGGTHGDCFWMKPQICQVKLLEKLAKF